MAEKRVTSATLMANGPAFEDAVRRLAAFCACSFGVHLNLTEFVPVSHGEGTKLLTGDDGLMRKSMMSARPAPAIWKAAYEELCAQIERVQRAGVVISHFDSHHHVHTVPFMLPVIKALQRRFGIRKVRLSKNIYTSGAPCSKALKIKKALYNRALRAGSSTTEGFTEFVSFVSAARAGWMPHQTVELMVHPGAPGSEPETMLLQSKWEDALPFAVRHVNYNDLH